MKISFEGNSINECMEFALDECINYFLKRDNNTNIIINHINIKKMEDKKSE